MAKYIYILWSKNHSVYVFGTIFLVQSNLCEALLVWVQQCLLLVKGHECVSILFLIYGSINDIISRVTPNVRMMNKMEMMQNEAVKYQLIYYVY
jgi:hypothetical protein